MNGTKKIKYSRTDQIILGIAYVFLGVFVLSILIPLIYVVLASFMDPTVLNNRDKFSYKRLDVRCIPACAGK